MTSDIDRQKAEAVARAQALAATRLETGESSGRHVEARAFIAAFYEHAPPADIAARSPEDLCGGALALWRFASQRPVGGARVRVYNPTSAKDGWSSTHTIVEIVNDDMPFLVDSVTAAINDRGNVVRLVIHPVVTAARDDDGQLMVFGAVGGISESWMQIEITRERGAAASDALAEALGRVLGDVRAAVSDWPKMREILGQLSESVERVPAPVPPAEVDEAAAFLRWIDDNNFTLLGLRNYDFAGGEVAPPLGVLHEPGYRVFGGLRDIDALPPDVRTFIRRRELLIIGKTDQWSTVHRRAPMDAIGIRRFDAQDKVSGL
ncbi:MAG TPA: NAD-glutamate dehydrogenase, partial [Stellaceae bacterium]|nr:NAD-glutamate dehydrogenase [Stellaceae bacterium]